MTVAYLVLGASLVASLRPSVAPLVPRRTALAASGGPPQYDKIGATLVANDDVGRASRLLRLESDEPLDYAPGHVLALEVEKDGEWLRGPYTVTRATEKAFDVVIRVCGGKSEAMAAAPLGSRWRFGGKFHVPILEGLAPGADRVVCLSTGTGVGPVLGFCEAALEATDLKKLTVLASYRDAADVCCKDAVQRLCVLHPDRFECSYVISSTDGRVSAPRQLDAIGAVATATTHFHLIGNGAMVNEWVAGLAAAGVPDGFVTTETYFNHKAEADADVVGAIAAAVSLGRVDAAPPTEGPVTFLEGGVML